MKTYLRKPIKILHFPSRGNIQKCLKWCPENCPRGKLPPVRVRVWFRISVRIRAGGKFSSEAIFLDSFEIASKYFSIFNNKPPAN